MIYEVNISIDTARLTEYLAWLPGHIDELLACPGFTSAATYRQPDENGKARITMHYFVTESRLLDAYLKDHAPRLRADAEKHFGGSFTATRRILQPL